MFSIILLDHALSAIARNMLTIGQKRTASYMAKHRVNFRSWHHTRAGETVACLWHTLWAIACLAQGILSVCYGWMAFAFVRLTASPAAECLFWLCVSSSIFGLGGAIWHVLAAAAHRAARTG